MAKSPTPPCRLAGLPVWWRLGALALAALLPVMSDAQCPATVWADEFEGSTVDTTKWSLQTGDGCAEGICGWGNNELQTYQADNATVSEGTLKIEAREQRVKNKNYTSARLRTLGKGEWYFGRMEARIRMTTGQGIWPAFWMLPTDEVYGGWPRSGEIDIVENIGSEPSTVHGTIHFGEAYPNNQSLGASLHLPDGERFADAFHEFAIEREPGVIRWYVDGALYATRTPADTGPAVWPFDERFHFLINVAVGGSWPGAPDATTVFPQVLEVDWVRVWDGNMPHLAGPLRVAHTAAGVEYSVANALPGSSFDWTVPADATIVSGQGTATVTIDFGAASGYVAVSVPSNCGMRSLQVPVRVDPAYTYEATFENFDDPATITLQSSTGALAEVANPDTSGINPSAIAGEYTRNAAERYDTIFYDVSTIDDASTYASEQKRFVLDVYTAAPAGTPIIIQLEDSSLATPANWPAGRHSRYRAFTSVQNSWERLSFVYVDSPDPATPNNGVDDLVMLFAPDSFTSDVYTFDNLDSYATGSGGGTATSVSVGALSVGTQSAGAGKKRGLADATVVDDLGNPVEGAIVSGTFSGDFSEGVQGTTGNDGSVRFTTNATRSGAIDFTFCVDDIAHPSLAYDAPGNAATCKSF